MRKVGREGNLLYYVEYLSVFCDVHVCGVELMRYG